MSFGSLLYKQRASLEIGVGVEVYFLVVEARFAGSWVVINNTGDLNVHNFSVLFSSLPQIRRNIPPINFKRVKLHHLVERQLEMAEIIFRDDARTFGRNYGIFVNRFRYILDSTQVHGIIALPKIVIPFFLDYFVFVFNANSIEVVP